MLATVHRLQGSSPPRPRPTGLPASGVARIRLEERNALAREIHDQLGQELTGLKMQLAAFVKRLDPLAPDLRADGVNLLGLVDQAIRSVRGVAAGLRARVHDGAELEEAIERLVDILLRPQGIQCDVRVTLDGVALRAESAAALYRVLQEIVTNVGRHAAARRVAIRLQRQGDDLELTVWDDGRGIRPEEAFSTTGLGLSGIRERSRSLGGRCEIVGSIGIGTRIRVTVPGGPAKAL
jgi:signal transduction histidine kinase